MEVEALAAEPIVALVDDAAVDEGAFALHGDGGLDDPADGRGLLELFPQLEADLGGLEGRMVLIVNFLSVCVMSRLGEAAFSEAAFSEAAFNEAAFSEAHTYGLPEFIEVLRSLHLISSSDLNQFNVVSVDWEVILTSTKRNPHLRYLINHKSEFGTLVAPIVAPWKGGVFALGGANPLNAPNSRQSVQREG